MFGTEICLEVEDFQIGQWFLFREAKSSDLGWRVMADAQVGLSFSQELGKGEVWQRRTFRKAGQDQREYSGK